jgi:hypothetical protein
MRFEVFTTVKIYTLISGFIRLIVLEVLTNVSEEPTSSIFTVEVKKEAEGSSETLVIPQILHGEYTKKISI